MFLTMFFKTQNIVQTMHLTMLIAHPYSSLHSNISNWLWWQQSEERLVQLAQPGQVPGEELRNIHP